MMKEQERCRQYVFGEKTSPNGVVAMEEPNDSFSTCSSRALFTQSRWSTDAAKTRIR
jgi:hypothetical protein